MRGAAENSVRIIIDADACPKEVLATCIALGAAQGFEVFTVANFNHLVQSPNHIVVGDNAQEADIMIANLSRSGDIVVTQDWGLAALVIGKGAACLSPSGREYRPETIDFLLEEREAKAKFRRGGNRTKGPKKRQTEDDANFLSKLNQIISRQASPL
jgi:uncharacterized protein YaiI (UPF0178 family)